MLYGNIHNAPWQQRRSQRHIKLLPLMLSAVLCIAGCSSCAQDGNRMTSLPEIAPGTHYGLGVSAPYAGVYQDIPVMAGGANFPEIPAADGGAKCFYTDIWGFDWSSYEWFHAGNLPSPSAYGATYTLKDRMIFAGGANASGTIDSVWSIRLDGKDADIQTLPPLPCPVEQGAAAMTGKGLYLAGGLSEGIPQTAVFFCDTDTFTWTAIAELPEPLVQPVALAYRDRIYIWGGYNPEKNCAVNYGYRYDIAARQWEHIGGVPDGGTLTGAASAMLPSGRLIVSGGVDLDIFTSALTISPEHKKAYMSQPPEAYRFRTRIMCFDPEKETWEEVADFSGAARAGAAIAVTGQGVLLLNGEMKPGIRSPQIWLYRPIEQNTEK